MKKKTRAQKLRYADARVVREVKRWHEWQVGGWCPGPCYHHLCAVARAIEARLKLDVKGKR